MSTPNDPPGVILAGGHFLSLGAARNLNRHRIPVWVVDCEVCVSQFSRSVRRFLKCPPPADDGRFVDFLLRTAETNDLRGWVILPSTDEFVRVLARHRDELGARYRVAVPDWDVVQHLYDKRLTNTLALRQSVPVPLTVVPGSEAELKALDLRFPVVVKPAITALFIKATKKKAYQADDLEALVAAYRLTAAVIDPSEILVQELIPGRATNLYSYFGLFQDGRPVVGFSARRHRQHPMDFGRASTFVETVRLPELETLATRFLGGVGYTGLAEVEFMYDERDSRFELLEVNPRIWGWHTIAIRAGVDLPYLAYLQARGEPVPGGTFREGVKWVRMLTDIPTVFREIRHGRMSVREYLGSMRGDKEYAVLSLRDPLPSIMELLLLPYYARSRGF